MSKMVLAFLLSVEMVNAEGWEAIVIENPMDSKKHYRIITCASAHMKRV